LEVERKREIEKVEKIDFKESKQGKRERERLKYRH
jgi:hypothetical protein